MRKLAMLSAMLFSTAGAGAQQQVDQIQFEVKFSKPLAVLEFALRLRPRAQTNQFKTLFTSSSFNNAKYSALIARLDSLPLDYEYDFPEYPPGEKIGGSTLYTIRRNLVLSDNVDEFRQRTIGLIPLIDLNSLTGILKEFTPVYDKVVYDSVRTRFESQLKSIDSVITAKNMAQYFTQAARFYRSAWDPPIPFLFVFYPLPNARGFTATAFGNVSMSALPTSYTDFIPVLTVMLHESSHILLDEQSLAFKKQVDGWFKSNPSKYSRYAQGLVQESWATAVANGYFQEKLSGQLSTRSWYNRTYNDLMAKAMYPYIKEYLDTGKPMDKALVDRQVETYETKFPQWIYEWDNLLAGRSVLSEEQADFDLIDRKYPYRHVNVYVHDFSNASFETLKRGSTKVVIVRGDNKRKLDLIKSHFPSLASWNPDPAADFSYVHLTPDKFQLIVVNLVKTTLEQQLDSKLYDAR